MNLLRASTTVGGMTALSRVTGFARDMLIANFIGAGAAADCFFVALRFPNLFRRVFGEGAIAAAFVPIHASALEGRGKEAARDFANQAFSMLALVLFVFVAVMEILMPWAMYVLAPGFEAVPGKMELATELSRIAFPYLLFISLVALQSGVLNSHGLFGAAAFAPVLFNLTLIAGLFGFQPFVESQAHALTWGAFAAGVVQLVWLSLQCARSGVPVRLVRPRLSPDVRTLGRRMVPVVVGASLYQVNLLVGTVLASLISDGAVAFLNYADRVVQLPLGIVGVAVGTALLPLLARQHRSGNIDAAMHNQNRGLELALLLTLPATVALLVIAEPITATLYERGRFTAADTEATALALAAFGIGLPAYVLIKVLSPAFFAREDTKTPVKIAAWAMVANIVLNVVLMQVLAHVGIALGSALSSWLNAVLLAVVLHRRGHLRPDSGIRRRLPRILLCCAAMGGVLWAGAQALAEPLAGGEMARIGALSLLVAGGGAVYGLLAWVSGAADRDDLRKLLRRRAA